MLKIVQKALHTTHLLKLPDKMYEYEMDSASILQDTEWTRFHPPMDRQMDWHMEKVKLVYNLSNLLKRGYN